MKIAIIGGGAAGMMAAATINETNPELEVFLIEKNDSLGKKVIISGGGRCNVTTGIEDIKMVLTKYPRGAKFLNSAMHLFPPASVRNWFESHGVPLKVEKDLRVFPVSNNGQDVVGALSKVFAKYNTQILLKHHVKELKKDKNNFTIYFKDQEPLTVDKVILTLGGQAYRHTGSTGDGYSLAESLGHHISALAPSLSSLTSLETWPAEVAGLSFVQATFSAQTDSQHKFSGPFVFTHWGVSGPAVFALSSLIAFEKFDQNKPLKIFIDLVPETNLEQVIQTLEKYGQVNPKKTFKYALHELVPISLAEVILDQLQIKILRKNSEISKKDLRRAAQWLKQVPLTIVSRRAGDEFVTAGGVDLSEVDPQTMQSKICPGLYFAGEILDIDGYTGGFNLQSAWATGHLAGSKISQD